MLCGCAPQHEPNGSQQDLDNEGARVHSSLAPVEPARRPAGDVPPLSRGPKRRFCFFWRWLASHRRRATLEPRNRREPRIRRRKRGEGANSWSWSSRCIQSSAVRRSVFFGGFFCCCFFRHRRSCLFVLQSQLLQRETSAPNIEA
jgi:hypothetical protein